MSSTSAVLASTQAVSPVSMASDLAAIKGIGRAPLSGRMSTRAMRSSGDCGGGRVSPSGARVFRRGDEPAGCVNVV